MRFLAASDIHGNHAVYKWLVRKAKEMSVDALVLAGDLLGCPDGYDTIEDAQRQDASAIVKIFESTRVPVYYIMGNDDLVELDPRPDQFVSIHGRRVELTNISLVGYQYSLPFMGGVYEKPENEIRADIDHLEGLVDAGTVLVTHSPAYGVLDRGVLDIHTGSLSILDLVRSRGVRVHIHGHIHECFGREDCHFNVASGGKYRAMIIDPETLEATVEKHPEDTA
jgi:Icc-related predicted phosphoesterase